MIDPEVPLAEHKHQPNDETLRDLAWSKYLAIDSPQYHLEHEALQSSEHVRPLFYRFGDQQLTLIASSHIDTNGRRLGQHDYNPASQYHADLDLVFDNYLKSTNPTERLAIVEGTMRPFTDREQSISTGSETGHLSWFAAEHDMPVISGEPSEAKLQSELFAAGVLPVELAALYSVWALGGMVRTTGSLASLSDHLLAKAKQANFDIDRLGSEVDLSADQRASRLIPELNAVLGRDWFVVRDGKPFLDLPDETIADSPSLERALADAWWPNRPGRINEVSRLSSDLRDKHLFKLLVDQVKNGKSPIVPFGSTHIARLKPVLDTYFGSSSSLDVERLPEKSLETATDNLESKISLNQALIEQGAVLEKDGDIEVYSSYNPEALLDWAVANNYILHGSTRRIGTDFTPQLADDSSKESGNRTAIYMVDIPPLAMFKAVTGGINASYTTHSGSEVVTIDSQGNRTPPIVEFAIDHPELIADYGYVYIFEATDADEYINGEYLSYKPIRPLAIVKIKRDQFNYPIEQLKT